MPVLTVDKKLPLLTLGDYLSQKRSLVVPQWQREYSWSTAEDREIDTLLKDLLKFARDENSKEYLMGSVVLCEPSANSPKPLLIDGQQRTITLSLLLMCINRYLTMNNLINGAEMRYATKWRSYFAPGGLDSSTNPHRSRTIHRDGVYARRGQPDVAGGIPRTFRRSV